MRSRTNQTLSKHLRKLGYVLRRSSTWTKMVIDDPDNGFYYAIKVIATVVNIESAGGVKEKKVTVEILADKETGVKIDVSTNRLKNLPKWSYGTAVMYSDSIVGMRDKLLETLPKIEAMIKITSGAIEPDKLINHLNEDKHEDATGD